MPKLNLGSGKFSIEGYISIDKDYHDLNVFPYPFKDNEIDEILCYHILEHLENLPRAMQEIHRILKPDGLVKIKCPYFSSEGAFNNPEHKNFITTKTFKYFKYFTIEKVNLYLMSEPEFLKPRLNQKILSKFQKLYQRWFCWILPCAEIHILLRKN